MAITEGDVISKALLDLWALFYDGLERCAVGNEEAQKDCTTSLVDRVFGIVEAVAAGIALESLAAETINITLEDMTSTGVCRSFVGSNPAVRTFSFFLFSPRIEGKKGGAAAVD